MTTAHAFALGILLGFTAGCLLTAALSWIATAARKPRKNPYYHERQES